MSALEIIYFTRYFFKAGDQHSVHSPFVYHLLTDCIQQIPKKTSLKNYFNKIQQYLETRSYSLHYCSNILELKTKETTADSEPLAYFISDIHKNKGTQQEWNSITKDKNIQISIDFWSFGLIFEKKDQEKEHFVLFKNRWR